MFERGADRFGAVEAVVVLLRLHVLDCHLLVNLDKLSLVLLQLTNDQGDLQHCTNTKGLQKSIKEKRQRGGDRRNRFARTIGEDLSSRRHGVDLPLEQRHLTRLERYAFPHLLNLLRIRLERLYDELSALRFLPAFALRLDGRETFLPLLALAFAALSELCDLLLQIFIQGHQIFQDLHVLDVLQRN